MFCSKFPKYAAIMPDLLKIDWKISFINSNNYLSSVKAKTVIM